MAMLLAYALAILYFYHYLERTPQLTKDILKLCAVIPVATSDSCLLVAPRGRLEWLTYTIWWVSVSTDVG